MSFDGTSSSILFDNHAHNDNDLEACLQVNPSGQPTALLSSIPISAMSVYCNFKRGSINNA